MSAVSEARTFARRVGIASCFTSTLAIAAGCALDPDFVARHFSEDGVLYPYTLRWLARYRAITFGATAAGSRPAG